ncbi:hypothetical protein N657DRAFT_281257 [Parathielavia appendiculata]|uniref:Serine aminopeptidase S33 domain-containing protein n=1 Tax=Parathielavia appendiculata TaxID=2587402 RepID=A0AAN6Z5J5_9PEZI|nr:hypothetical protein N657DRAFT_281257 [Parathielavia appendiculata]
MPVHGLYLEAARAFQKAGITVLLYDNRGVGASDDTPRGEANAAKQTEDLHEAVFFLKRFPAVDARRIALGVIHFRGMRPGRRSVGQAHQSRCRHLPGRAVRLGQPGEAKPLPRPRDARHRIPCKRQPAALYGPCGLGDEDDTVYDYRLFRCTNAMTVDDVVSTLERIPGFSNQIPVRAFYNMISWAVRELGTVCGADTGAPSDGRERRASVCEAEIRRHLRPSHWAERVVCCAREGPYGCAQRG